MILGQVTGTVVSTAKHPAYIGRKLLIVQPLDEARTATGKPFLAVDEAQAGVGDTVLVLREGTGTRQVLGPSPVPLPVLEVIVGIVDAVEVAR